MHATVRLSLLLLAMVLVCQAYAQDNDPTDSSLAAISTRSCFAHGYLSGYEEGFHLGNVDINMGRQARTKLAQFHGLTLRYSSSFGPRPSYEHGFYAGLQAGYGDGFAGRPFRAITLLRSVSEMMEQNPPSSDPKGLYFDEGVATGYQQGRESGISDGSGRAEVDFRVVSCTKSQDVGQQFPVQSYCDGYRRGFALGHADGFALRPERAPLEASK